MSDYRAPWSPLLIGITVGISGLLLSMAFFMGSSFSDAPWYGLVSLLGLLLGIPLISALFMILGYTITDEEIIVKHPGWQRRFPLAMVTAVEVDPNAMSASLRTWGNGGLFSFSGRFRNSHLGPYRAYATDRNNAVVLYFGKAAPVVLTPENPLDFAATVAERLPQQR